MDFGLAPDEWLGVCVVGIDEVVDVLSELFDRGEGFVAQGRRQHNSCALPQSMLRLRRADQALKLGPLRCRQNSCRLWEAAHTPLNRDSFFIDSGY